MKKCREEVFKEKVELEKKGVVEEILSIYQTNKQQKKEKKSTKSKSNAFKKLTLI
jgi:uncharacterized OB-fold protein